MAFGVGTGLDEYMVGDSDSWGGPLNGVDLEAQAGVSVGGSSWHTRMTVDLWAMIIIIGAVVALWVLGGVVFRRVNVL
jgi:hypothetical protein